MAGAERLITWLGPTGTTCPAGHARAAGARGRFRCHRAGDPGPAGPGLRGEEVLRALGEHPELLRRPILEKGDYAVPAPPAERAADILD